MPTAQLRIPAQAEQVRTARLVAGAAARRAGVSEDVIDEVRLAVGEACARAVVRHQSESVADHVEIDLEDADGRFTVQVRDRVGASADADDELGDEMALALIAALAPMNAFDQVVSGRTISMSWPVEDLDFAPPS